MKKIVLATLFLFLINSYSQKKENSKSVDITYDLTRKVEDRNGHIITDTIEKLKYLKEIEKQRALRKKATHRTTSNITPVYLCANGSFEEYETISDDNYLTNYVFIEGVLLNPAQCRIINEPAITSIPIYNPNNTDLMVTTVPSNYLDEFIGNINAFDQFALKLNYKDSFNTAALVQAKRFKTNNETSLKFNFKTVLQTIKGNGHLNEQPFFKARIVNNSGIVVSEFCLIGDPKNCIFTQAPTLEEDGIVLYTQNWQAGILDISSIPNNENFTIEFQASRCGLGGHFGYAYVDDICFLHTNETLQGSIELDPLNKVCPTLPISVCGSFTIPSSGSIAATVSSIILNVKDASNAIVYTTTTTSSLDLVNKRFCFDLTAANLPNTTTGTYNVSAEINYGIVQTNCSGTSFNSAHDDDANLGWDIWFLNCANCPISLQKTSVFKCDTNNDGQETFDLTTAESQIINPSTGLTFSYYRTINDATNNTNPITNTHAYLSYNSTVFVRVSQSATCYKIIPLDIIVKNPHAIISGILNICSGSTVLNATLGNNYLWNTGQSTQSITVNSPGTYSVTVVDTNGCSSSASTTILTNQVAPEPTLQITQPTCSVSTGSITITSPAAQISFDNGATWTTNPNSGNLPIGTYTIKITTATGCISYGTTVTLVAILPPFPNFTSVDPTFCGDTGSITIVSTADFYSFDDGVTWGTSNVATNLPTGTYKIRTKNALGCISNYNSVTLNSEFLDTLHYIQNNPYCGHLGSITITTPAAYYSFDGGTTWQASNTLTNIQSGSYLIKIKNAQECTSPIEYVYLSDLENTFPITNIDEAGCGKYATITIQTPGDYYSFDGGLTWTTNNTISNLNSGSNFNIIVKKLPNCLSLNTHVAIFNNYYPLPLVNDYNASICDNLNDGIEAVDLTSFNTNFIANPNNYSFSYYTTQAAADNQDISLQIQNPSIYSMSYSNNKAYASVTDNSTGCHKTAVFTIKFINSPTSQMLDTYTLCENNSVIIDAGAGYNSYHWSTGHTSQSDIFNNTGNYWITVTTNQANGLVCSSTKNFTIFLSNYATITNIELVDWTDFQNVITVQVSGIGNYEYSLDGIHYQDSNVFSNLDIGIYHVYVKDKFGCGVVSEEVFLMNYPKFFTPNNDGVNDNWRIYFSHFEPGIRTEILDRFGKLIKVLYNNDSWDGTYNGHLMPSDDYWFVVHRTDGKVHKGHFAMKR
ncbi:T9SS type B sorting domain-containing protein [Flavobacterium sp. SUN046]|uniref:T9SS type B sorting domain-containing protein n=1 Tax=Flavobacterium sp. SUN046 TaxID=3002440 RepID=UPI002DB68F36|nr:T9SS type B sorting domain-containing protein [Flavobacterium sp. SUN046]MEC4049444.1 T9SS type B sorting domain-containing protein [Flavobacterium sp. SUN046]